MISRSICSKWYIISCRCIRNKCVEIYELNPAHFLSAPGLVWQDYLKKTEVKLELLTDIDLLKKELVVEYAIQYIHMQMRIISIWKIMTKTKNHISCTYLDANNLLGWAMCQRFPVGGFKRKKKHS